MRPCLFSREFRMTCWVYVLRGRNGRHYTGITRRLARRIHEHDQGRTAADAARGPFELIYKEPQSDHDAARLREKFLKSGAGREWLKKYLAERSVSATGG